MEAVKVIEAFNSVYEFLKNIREIYDKSKKGRWNFLGSKKTETIERKFKEALMGARSAIESNIWYGKGFALASECGIKVDKEFHDLMGLLIAKFNDIHMGLDSEKLDESLIEHITGQLEILEEYAQRFWNLQGIGKYHDKEVKAVKTIENFRSRLWDFTRSMEPYLRESNVSE